MQIDTLGVYWGPRKESIEDCAQRIALYLTQLIDKFGRLGEWYEKVLTKKSAPSGRAVNTYEVSELVTLLAKGINKRDIDRQPMHELGYRIGLWNKQKSGVAIGLTVRCGMYSEVKGLANSVVMQLPSDLSAVLLNDASTLKMLLLLTSEIWDADWGAVFSTDSDIVVNQQDNSPFLDKMLWVSTSYQFSFGEKGVLKEQLGKGVLYSREL